MVNKNFGILIVSVIAQTAIASQSLPSIPALSTKAISGKAQEIWGKSDLEPSQKAATMYMYLRDLRDHHGREALTKVMNPDEGIRIPLQDAFSSLESVELFKVYLQFHADPLKQYGGRTIAEKVLRTPGFSAAVEFHKQANICEPFLARLLAGEYPSVIAGELKNLIDTNVIPSDVLIDTLKEMARIKRDDANSIQKTIEECQNLILGHPSDPSKNVTKQSGWFNKALSEPRFTVGQAVVAAGTVGLASFIAVKLSEKGLISNFGPALFGVK